MARATTLTCHYNNDPDEDDDVRDFQLQVTAHPAAVGSSPDLTPGGRPPPVPGRARAAEGRARRAVGAAPHLPPAGSPAASSTMFWFHEPAELLLCSPQLALGRACDSRLHTSHILLFAFRL